MDKLNNDDHTAKAYDNRDFLHSPWSRTIRMLAEYQFPLSRFTEEGVTGFVVFFGSARIPAPEKSANSTLEGLTKYYQAARELSRRLTDWFSSLENRRLLVCSGGGPGIMEAANRGAQEVDGESIALNISLPHEQKSNGYVPEKFNINFHYFFFRKFWFINLAEAIVIFPGGFGTLDELLETLTLVQTDKMGRRIPIVMFGSSFWHKVINFDVLVEFGVIDAKDLEYFRYCDTVDEAFSFITQSIRDNPPLTQEERGILPC